MSETRFLKFSDYPDNLKDSFVNRKPKIVNLIIL